MRFVVEEVAVATLHVIQQRLGRLRHLRQRAVDEHARRMPVSLRCLLLRLRCGTARGGGGLVLQRVGKGGGSPQGEHAGCASVAQQIASGYAWSCQTIRESKQRKSMAENYTH